MQVTRSAAAATLVLAATVWTFQAGAAPLADRAFTVANYPVEATAKDAVTAKSTAIDDGQQAAFRSLLKRLVPVTSYNRMDRLKAVKASEYLDGFAVRSEQNSPTRYIASLDFSFQADAVRDLLRREGVPFVDVQAPKTVLIPVTRDMKPVADGDSAAPDQAPAPLRAAGGTWNEVWKGLDLENTLTPVRLEPLRPAISSDTLGSMLGGDNAALSLVAGEYKSDHIVVAVAEPDLAANRLNVTLAGYDGVGSIHWKRSYRLADSDLDYTMELAAVVSLGVLEGRWKAASDGGSGAGGSAGDIAVAVEFQSLEEWNDIRGRLLDLPGIDDVRIGAVSARTAEVTLRYPGGAGLLANELAPQGLALRNTGSGWSLRSAY
ncbi:MAG: DUF2066 domain-containing protein [Hyphomicrobium sp.]